ncbi:MAG: hypothetical protein GY820_21910 [Gammaproteobacteria bacterium]|nr:hypothetical protein [Gammaproteobacteria bacterium]
MWVEQPDVLISSGYLWVGQPSVPREDAHADAAADTVLCRAALRAQG